VLASALGPVVLASGQKFCGSYGPVVQWLAGVAFALAVICAALTPSPSPAKPGEESKSTETPA
jgi:hypothetical protein